jgi:hypothetical protein
MLMECIKGSCAVDMPDCRQDVPAQVQEKFYAEEAGILVSVRVECSKLIIKLNSGN